MVTTRKGVHRVGKPQIESKSPRHNPTWNEMLELVKDPVFLKAQLARLRKEGYAETAEIYTSQLNEMVSREIGQIQTVSGRFVKYLSLRVVRRNDAAPIITTLRLGKKIPVASTLPSLPESPAN